MRGFVAVALTIALAVMLLLPESADAAAATTTIKPDDAAAATTTKKPDDAAAATTTTKPPGPGAKTSTEKPGTGSSIRTTPRPVNRPTPNPDLKAGATNEPTPSAGSRVNPGGWLPVSVLVTVVLVSALGRIFRI